AYPTRECTTPRCATTLEGCRPVQCHRPAVSDAGVACIIADRDCSAALIGNHKVDAQRSGGIAEEGGAAGSGAGVIYRRHAAPESAVVVPEESPSTGGRAAG